MLVEISENILAWSPSIFQNSNHSEVFCFVKKEQVKKLNYVESELDAIERIKTLRQLQRELGIEREESYYRYAKIAFMEQNDLGLKVTDEHFFKDTNNDNIFMSFN